MSWSSLCLDIKVCADFGSLKLMKAYCFFPPPYGYGYFYLNYYY
jgi:hypothetical protein